MEEVFFVQKEHYPFGRKIALIVSIGFLYCLPPLQAVPYPYLNKDTNLLLIFTFGLYTTYSEKYYVHVIIIWYHSFQKNGGFIFSYKAEPQHFGKIWFPIIQENYRFHCGCKRLISCKLHATSVEILLLQCTKNTSLLRCTTPFLYHSSLLMEACNKRMAYQNFWNVAKMSRAQMHLVSNCLFHCRKEKSSSEIHDMFTICSLKRSWKKA